MLILYGSIIGPGMRSVQPATYVNNCAVTYARSLLRPFGAKTSAAPTAKKQKR